MNPDNGDITRLARAGLDALERGIEQADAMKQILDRALPRQPSASRTVEQAVADGFTVLIPDEELARVKKMSRKARRAWAKSHGVPMPRFNEE